MKKAQEVLRALLSAALLIACILSFSFLAVILAVFAIYVTLRWMLCLGSASQESQS